MNIIEKDKDLHLLNPEEILLIVPVWSSQRGHQSMFPISFVYIKTKDTDFILNFQHIDAEYVTPFPLSKLCNLNTLVLGNRYIQSNGLDYEWVYFESVGKPFVFNDYVETLFKGYRNDYLFNNDCIPLMKWYELLKSIPDGFEIKDWYRKYSDSISLLGKVEGAGVQVEVENFIDRFSFDSRYIDEGRVYTQYNPYTITGRPSNRHLNVNYSALPKGDGSRGTIISRWSFGTLIQFDYESYHIRLIAGLIGYKFPTDITAHQYLANYYGCDYETSKGLTFKYLYGGLDDFARKIPFFQKVDSYIDNLYQRYVISGKLTTPLFKREINHNRIESPTQQKIFNYLLQALETEINYMKMVGILEFLSGMKSKIVLYTYDAFLIDTHPTERDKILELLPTIMEKGGFPIRADEGTNYDNLVHLQ
jgi:hypothetical protein